MGMTIDRTIEFFNGLECHTPQAKDARDVAMETMRKYQKIQEIINIYDSTDISYKDTLQDIKEVLEDGNE